MTEQAPSPEGSHNNLKSLAGSTRDGAPLSFNRAACEELQPWICRLYATKVEAPKDNVVSCGVFSDVPILRFVLKGDLHGETALGPYLHSRGTFFYGPNSKRMPATFRGGFSTVAVQFHPGAVGALGGPEMGPYVDRIVDLSEIYPDMREEWLDDFRLYETPDVWVDLVEKCMLQFVRAKQPEPPSETIRIFDRATLVDPNLQVGELARSLGINPKTLTRQVMRDYGMAPKRVLRRARALDLAASLRGISDGEEREEAVLRYYDQSHMIRDFVEMFGMTPMVFARSPQPIITLTIEARQARKFEALEMMRPGETPSWRDPAAELGPTGTPSRKAS